jgi:hypothetical protein
MFSILRINELGDQKVSDLYFQRESIDFYPYYQRVSNIWDSRKKKLLIDSIINGYDLPKFYLHFITSYNNDLNESGKNYAVIDGKQRLMAIFDFIDGRFNLSSDFVYLNDSDIDLKEKSYSDLTYEFPEIKAKFDNYVLDIIFIKTDEQDRIEELFLRLNEGEPLNNAERRNSMNGYLIRKINSIVRTNDFFERKVKFKNKRFEHQDTLAKTVLLEKNNNFTSFTKRSLDQLIEENQNENSSIINVITEVECILNIMINIFDDKDSLLRTKNVIPLYYWFIKNSRDDILLIRDFLLTFEDIRIRNRRVNDATDVVTVLLEFDRLNQQGANQSKSLQKRYNILVRYFDKYKNVGYINQHTTIHTEDLFENSVEEMV